MAADNAEEQEQEVFGGALTFADPQHLLYLFDFIVHCSLFIDKYCFEGGAGGVCAH